MSWIELPRMIVSSHAGWDTVERRHPSTRAMFLRLVLPMSLLPPAMILFASSHVGAERYPGIAFETWALLAATFLALELLSVPAMAWIIRMVAADKGARADEHDAFMVAAIAPVPLWLSSLVLLQSQVWLIVVVPLVAMAASAGLIRNGVERMLHVDEEVDAEELSMIVITMGVLAWMVLVGIMLLPTIMHA